MLDQTPEYNPTVWTHFRAPHNTGTFAPDTARVFAGRAGARRHGREVEFQLRLTSEDRIADCRYRVYGCPATIALCSMTSEALVGLTLPEAARYSVVALVEQLDLPAEKRAAAITVEDAIRSAAAGYNSMPPSKVSAGFEAKQA